MARQRFLVALLLAASAGCGGDDTAAPPAAVAREAARLAIMARGQLNMTPGLEVPLLAGAWDQAGFRMPLSVTWRSSNTAAASVSPAGRVRALATGTAWVHVSAGSLRDSMFVDVRQPSGTFDIKLFFDPDIPERWRAELEKAAATWEQYFVGELEPYVLDVPAGTCGNGGSPLPALLGVERGIRIYIQRRPFFPVNTPIEAVAGPCIMRPMPRPTAVVGSMLINSNIDVDRLPDGRLWYLALHEMAHVFGLVGVLTQEHSHDMQTRAERDRWIEFDAYHGPAALGAWRRLTGDTVRSIPVANGLNHWQDIQLDVMNHGVIIENMLTVSDASIGALFDYGYPARLPAGAAVTSRASAGAGR